MDFGDIILTPKIPVHGGIYVNEHRIYPSCGNSGSRGIVKAGAIALDYWAGTEGRYCPRNPAHYKWEVPEIDSVGLSLGVKNNLLNKEAIKMLREVVSK
jgi:hypothetical protein